MEEQVDVEVEVEVEEKEHLGGNALGEGGGVGDEGGEVLGVGGDGLQAGGESQHPAEPLLQAHLGEEGVHCTTSGDLHPEINMNFTF